MEINLATRVSEVVNNKMKRYVQEAAEGVMSAEDIDDAISKLIDELIEFQKQAKPHVDGDADLEASLTSRINTSVAQLSQLKKKMSVAMAKKGVDSVDGGAEDDTSGEEAPQTKRRDKDVEEESFRSDEAGGYGNVNLASVDKDFLLRILAGLKALYKKVGRSGVSKDFMADMAAIERHLGLKPTGM